MKNWLTGYEKDLDFWITLCLAYNKDVKPSKKAKKK
jgi:hypothetical protein